jgi:hypothetical protein
MNKFYNLLEWLDITQAIDFLSHLTGTTVSKGQLMVLCRGVIAMHISIALHLTERAFFRKRGLFAQPLPALGTT